MMPCLTTAGLLAVVIGLYLSVVLHGSDTIPSYILVAFPILSMFMLIVASIAHVEYAQVYSVSGEICKTFQHERSVSAVLAERTRIFLMLKRRQQEQNPNGFVAYNMEMQMLLLSNSRNPRSTRMRPLRVEAGTFGCYFQLGFACAYVEEMCNYFLLLLQLRNSP